MLKCEENKHSFPHLHHIFITKYLGLVTIYHLLTCPIRPMFYGSVKNIQLHKQLLHCCVFYHGATMIEQMKNQSKFDNFFLLVNVHYIMCDLLHLEISRYSQQDITFQWQHECFFSKNITPILNLEHGHRSFVTTFMFS